MRRDCSFNAACNEIISSNRRIISADLDARKSSTSKYSGGEKKSSRVFADYDREND